MDKAIIVTVPIVVKDESKGVKQQGGLLDFVTRDIEVECLPTNIPENITVDVSELMLHESIRVRDLPVDPKWRAISEGDTMLVHIVMPKAEEEPAAATADAAAATAAAPAEPEVIKKGKTEEKEEATGKEKK
jgi:large subunit ribosomal protein L25